MQDSKAKHLGAGHTDRIARDLLKCDEAILEVLVTDSNAAVLSFVESERIPEAYKEPLQNMEQHARPGAIMLGAVCPGDKQTGG